MNEMRYKTLTIITAQGVRTYELGTDGVTDILDRGITPVGAHAFLIVKNEVPTNRIETPFFDVEFLEESDTGSFNSVCFKEGKKNDQL